MNRSLAIVAVLFLAGIVRADETLKSQTTQLVDDTSRGGHGGQGHSQQYHYNSYPSDGYTYAGLSFDLSTGLFLALGAIIVLLALAAVCYPLLSSKSGGNGWGWADSGSGGYGGSGWSRSYNFAGTAEKVLNSIEKMYQTYGKKH